MAADRLCPSCGDLIAADAPGCRRCGYDTTAGPAPGPAAAPQPQPHVPPANASPYSAAYAQSRVFTHNPADDRASWQEVAIKIMAVLFIVHGALDCLVGVITVAKYGTTAGFGIGYGAVSLLIGIGLLAEWELASIALKIYCWLSILGFAGGIILFLGIAMSGFTLGWLGVLIFGIFLGLYIFMLYLVNEVGQA